MPVVAGTAKVRNLKQITTDARSMNSERLLLLVLQKYEISSKSQPLTYNNENIPVVAGTAKVRNLKQITTDMYNCCPLNCCCWYCKSTKSQANHNVSLDMPSGMALLLVLQKYEISSKSQRRY